MKPTKMTLRLEWINEQDAVPLPEGIFEKMKELLALLGEAEGVTAGEVAVTVTDDARIRELNRQYRGLDKPTDVLSFSMLEAGEGEPEIRYGGGDGEEEAGFLPEEIPLGDIVISAETAKRQSEEYGHSFERELGFLFVHGFLHLIGYDHEDAESEKVMTEKQEAALRKAGLSR